MLMIDTVGFIRDLPPDLVDAFKSTLEEVFFADLILLAFDSSEDDETIAAKIQTSLGILLPHVVDGEVVLVGTKVDRIDTERRDRVKALIQGIVPQRTVIMTSSETGEGLESLRDWISIVQGNVHGFEVTLPLTDASFRLLSRLYNIAEVTHEIVDGLLRASIWCNPSEADKVRAWLTAAGAQLLRDSADDRGGTNRVPQEGEGPLSG